MMVSEEVFAGKKTYCCEICGFHYVIKADAEAEACEEGCRDGFCDSEVTAKSLERS